jgi:hypothetical protein
MKNGFDEIRDERKKVCALALAYRYGLYGLRARIGDIKDESVLLHRAYVRDHSRPQRPPILVFVGQDKGVFEAGIRAWLVTDFDVVVTGPSDATGIWFTKYVLGAIARKDHLRKASGSTLSNGIVKKYGIALFRNG